MQVAPAGSTRFGRARWHKLGPTRTSVRAVIGSHNRRFRLNFHPYPESTHGPARDPHRVAPPELDGSWPRRATVPRRPVFPTLPGSRRTKGSGPRSDHAAALPDCAGFLPNHRKGSVLAQACATPPKYLRLTAHNMCAQIMCSGHRPWIVLGACDTRPPTTNISNRRRRLVGRG